MKNKSQILLVFGGDEFAVKNRASERVKEISGGAETGADPRFDIIHGDDEKKSRLSILGEFIMALETPPFLADSKIVWLKNFNFGTKNNKADSATKKDGDDNRIDKSYDRIKEILKDGPPPGMKVVISGFNLDGRSSLYKYLEKVAEIDFCEKIDLNQKGAESKQNSMIVEILCEKRGGHITQELASMILNVVGGDSGRIMNELDKLLAFVYPDKNITEEAVNKIVSRTPEVAYWTFSSAMVLRDLKGALRALDISLNLPKSSEIAMLRMLMNEFLLVLNVKLAVSLLGLPPNANHYQIAKSLSSANLKVREMLGKNPILTINNYRASKLASAPYSVEELKEAIRQMQKVDRTLVSTKMIDNGRIELEQLAIKVCRIGLD